MGTALLPAFRSKAQDSAILQREDDDDEERLRRWMAVRASRSPDLGWLGGAAIGVGVLAIGGGVAWTAATDEPDRTLLSVGLVAAGALEIGLGLFTLLTPNLSRDEYQRIPTQTLSEREIGRLEGLLRRDAELAGVMRQLMMWTGLGLAVGGFAAMPIVALDPPATDRELGLSWGIAGGAAFLGALYFVISLFESSAEGDWRDYQRGLMPREMPQISLVPTGNGFAVMF